MKRDGWPGVLKMITACQLPLANRKPDEWWADMEEVFHARVGRLDEFQVDEIIVKTTAFMKQQLAKTLPK